MSSETNVGAVDRVIRIGVGAFLLSVFYRASGPDLTLLGIAPLLSGLLGFCPVYFYAGRSTATASTTSSSTTNASTHASGQSAL